MRFWVRTVWQAHRHNLRGETVIQAPKLKLGIIAKAISYTVLGLLMAVGTIVVISTFPIAGNFRLLVVESGSMEPAIGLGSIVVVKPGRSYTIGDIVTYQGGFRDRRGRPIPITHRIVEMRVDRGEPIYLTQGDANNAPDVRELHSRDIIGRVRVAVPYVGYAVNTARTPYGFLALIIIPAAIVMFDQGQTMLRELKNMRRRKTIPSNG